MVVIQSFAVMVKKSNIYMCVCTVWLIDLINQGKIVWLHFLHVDSNLALAVQVVLAVKKNKLIKRIAFERVQIYMHMHISNQ